MRITFNFFLLLLIFFKLHFNDGNKRLYVYIHCCRQSPSECIRNYQKLLFLDEIKSERSSRLSCQKNTKNSQHNREEEKKKNIVCGKKIIK